jgi:hypothetical protein
MKATGSEMTVTNNQVCGNSVQYLLAQQFIVVVTKEGSKHANQCFDSQSYQHKMYYDISNEPTEGEMNANSAVCNYNDCSEETYNKIQRKILCTLLHVVKQCHLFDKAYYSFPGFCTLQTV